MQISIISETDGIRLDVYMAKKYPEYSRGYFQRLISSGHITVNAKESSPSSKLKEGDLISADFGKEPGTIEAENIPIDIIYEDDDVIVINKAVGMVVHPAHRHYSGTLVNALAGKLIKPLLVHRLDKDTSGVIIVAKNERAKNSLVKQFQRRSIKKTYLAAVEGCVSEEKGYIDAPLGRSLADRRKIVVGPLSKKESVTEFSVTYRSKAFSLLEVRPLTGRTHQIRSHLAYIGHPILGDDTYGGKKEIGDLKFSRQMLHAYKISFIHPSKSRRIEFCAPPPRDIAELFKNKYE